MDGVFCQCFFSFASQALNKLESTTPPAEVGGAGRMDAAGLGHASMQGTAKTQP
jgi:hypothetical protein